MSKKSKKHKDIVDTMQTAVQSARVREVRNLYEAAAAGRRTQHWRSSILDATSEIAAATVRVRSIARDMVRNNAFAARAKSVISHNVVGAGIVPRIEGVAARTRKAILSHLETTDIDADGRHNIYGIQAVAMAAIVESGEVIIRRRKRYSSDGYALPFQLQILESDYLDHTRHGRLPGNNIVVHGVEIDDIGRRVAYWLFPFHPGSTSFPQASVPVSERVPAEDILHIYRMDRPGQMRGMTWFAPVILRMRDFADFTDAQLVRQKIAACFAAFITTADSFEGQPQEGDPYPIESFEPGMIERLRPEESVQFATPPTTQDFSAYSSVTLREIAVGLGVTYEALTSDLTGVNYSSGRMGWLEFQRNIDAWRWLMLMPQMMDPIAKWVNEAVGLASGTQSNARFTWTPPRREMIDPTTETKAARDAIRAGLSSRSEELRRFGCDPEEVDNEIASENARADAMGLVFDSDPRMTTGSGQLQSTGQPQGGAVQPDALAPEQAPAN